MWSASREWRAAALGLALVVGVSAGVVIDRFVLATPERHVAAEPSAAGSEPGARDESRGNGRHREPLLDRLTRELELTDSQHDALETVLADNRGRARQYWKESRGRYNELREEFRAAIRAVLTEEQRARFDELLARDQQRREGRRRQSNGRR